MARVEHAKVWAGLSEIGSRDMPGPQEIGSYGLAPAARSLQEGEHWALESVVCNLSSNGRPVESYQEEIYWKRALVSEEYHCQDKLLPLDLNRERELGLDRRETERGNTTRMSK
ncbi:hypothetical protein J7337_004892 [Fusarium musae]|uniref:Uncharacterized protein n=1 Tax=Fusarium musae TaxID=1042133 RepID=A0A9P8DN47_9HYPO|nr:hypothetical protein J7337_004892 [Fusarium musae]